MTLTFLAPQFLWAFLALPLIVLLHFIRARKQRQPVSALFLWKEAKKLAEERRRFSPTWLLFLQLLFAGLAALALAQPRLLVAGPPDRVIVVDASASMAARDGDGVRLEKARRVAADLIAGAGQVAIVRAGLDATVIQPVTADRGDAARALETLVAADREADLGRAASLALSILEGAEVHVVTDGEPPTGARIQHHAVGGDGVNVGVTTFDIGLQQAFVGVTSNHPRPQEIGLELYQDGALIAQTTLLVPSQGRANTSFPLQRGGGFFEARLAVPDWDALPLDDRAFAGRRALRVALTAEEETLVRALAAIPDLSYQVTPFLNAPNFDARVVFGSVPDPLPEGNTLIFPAPAETPDYQFVRDWDRSDPLLRFVSLEGAVVGLGPETAPEGEGWRVLARTGDLRPVLSVFEDGERRAVAVGVHPTQTDLVNRAAFPLLIANVMGAFRAEERLPLGATLPPGSLLEAQGGAQPRNRAAEPGIYQIGGERVAVSLLSATETRLPNVPATAPPLDTAPAADSEQVRTLALWLVLLALLALLAEWLLFAGKRPRLPVRRRS